MRRNSISLLSRSHPRRGAFIVLGMLMLLLVSMLGASLVQTVVMARRQVERTQWRVQADWLVHAGCQRAISRLRVNPEQVSEVWTIPADHLDGRRSAQVRILIEPDHEMAERMLVSVDAEYPRESTEFIRISRRFSVLRDHRNNQ